MVVRSFVTFTFVLLKSAIRTSSHNSHIQMRFVPMRFRDDDFCNCLLWFILQSAGQRGNGMFPSLTYLVRLALRNSTHCAGFNFHPLMSGKYVDKHWARPVFQKVRTSCATPLRPSRLSCAGLRHQTLFHRIRYSKAPYICTGFFNQSWMGWVNSQPNSIL